jgi:hypothetical protein
MELYSILPCTFANSRIVEKSRTESQQLFLSERLTIKFIVPEFFGKEVRPMNQICKEQKRTGGDSKQREISTFQQSQQVGVPCLVHRHSARDFGGRSNVL